MEPKQLKQVEETRDWSRVSMHANDVDRPESAGVYRGLFDEMDNAR